MFVVKLSLLTHHCECWTRNCIAKDPSSCALWRVSGKNVVLEMPRFWGINPFEDISWKSKWISIPLTTCMLCAPTGIWRVENVASWWGRKSTAPRVIYRRFGRYCWYYWYCSALMLRTSKIVANHYIIEQKPYCVGSYDSLTSCLSSWSSIKQFTWWWQTASLRNWCTMLAMPRFGYGVQLPQTHASKDRTSVIVNVQGMDSLGLCRWGTKGARWKQQCKSIEPEMLDPVGSYYWIYWWLKSCTSLGYMRWLWLELWS